MAFTIRALTAQDEQFLWDMLYLAIYIPEGHPLPSRDILKAPALSHYVTGWCQRPGDLGFAALETSQPVGAAWLRLFSERDKGYGYVNDQTPELTIALLPGYRGQGIGKTLIDALLQSAGKKFDAVSLSVSIGNPAAHLYRRLGFEVVADDGTSQTMLKRLN